MLVDVGDFGGTIVGTVHVTGLPPSPRKNENQKSHFYSSVLHSCRFYTAVVPLFVPQGVLDAQFFVETCPVRGSVLTPTESEDS